MENKYTTLLFDADDTLLDFEADERTGLTKAFKSFGVALTKTDIETYSKINLGLWKQFEKGEIEKSQIGKTRYEKFLEYLCRDELKSITPEIANKQYMECLSNGGNLIDGATEVCEYLKEKGYSLYIITNGTGVIQKSRFQRSGLLPYINGLFISDYIGYQKPKKEFFDAVFKEITEKDKSKILVIGDSLSSDIKGAQNAGLDFIWYNRGNSLIPDEIPKDAVINHIKELFNKL